MTKIKSRRFPVLLAGLVTTLALVVSACASGSQMAKDTSGNDTLRIAVYPGAFASLPDYVGVDTGIYKEHGISADLTEIPTGPSQVAAVASRSVDVIGTSTGLILLANAQGQDLVYLNNYLSRLYYTFIAQESWPTPNAQKPYPAPIKDLKGAKIGISGRGSEAELLLRTMLLDAGLNPDEDVTWITVGGYGQSAISAFKEGQVDVVAAIEPMKTLLMNVMHVGKPLLDLNDPAQGSETLRAMPGQGRATLRNTADANEDTFRRYNEAQAKVLEFMKDPAHLDEVAEIYANHGGLDATVARQIIETNTSIIDFEFNCSGIAPTWGYLKQTNQLTADQGAVGAPSCADFIWKGSHEFAHGL
ncbi:hypothetical protein AXA44_30930 [Rhodococcus sp. SC4]|nr:hypothetical protein AXA44_30930 [Rhodococcus sp. SC4]